jgi:hypothetical protein
VIGKVVQQRRLTNPPQPDNRHTVALASFILQAGQRLTTPKEHLPLLDRRTKGIWVLVIVIVAHLLFTPLLALGDGRE